MNTTMFNVALPTVLSDLSLNSSTASWIVSSYSIVFAISTLTFSRLSDFIPISKLLLIGITILGVASIVGFFSSDFYLLLIVRILQAAGAGAVPGACNGTRQTVYSYIETWKSNGIYSFCWFIGIWFRSCNWGNYNTVFRWQYLFGITCIVVLFIPFFRKLLPNEEVKKGQFDLWGAILTGLSVTGLLLFSLHLFIWLF